MKPLKPVYPIVRLGVQIHSLENRRFTAPKVLRLIKLLLGTDVNHLIDEPGIYFGSNFGQLASTLKYQHVHDLVDEVRQSGLFAVGLDSARKTVLWFASPVFLNMDNLRTQLEAMQQTANISTSEDVAYGGIFLSAAGNFTGKFNGSLDSLFALSGFNIILPGGTAAAESAAETDEPKTTPQYDTPTIRLSHPQRKEIVASFIRTMADSSNADFFESIRQQLRADNYNEDEQQQIINYLLYNAATNYFLEQDRFFFPNMNHESRRAWLTNLLYGRSGPTYLTRAKRIVHNDRQKTKAREEAERQDHIRQHHPVSPFEWQDPTTSVRYYEDAFDGVRTIPADFPPRPSDTAYISGNNWQE